MKRTKKAVVFLGILLAIAVLALAARSTPQPVEKQPEAYGMFEWEEAAVEDPEAAAELRVLGQIFPKDLDGHQPVEPVTACLVHPGHAPGADDLQDLISIIE